MSTWKRSPDGVYVAELPYGLCEVRKSVIKGKGWEVRVTGIGDAQGQKHEGVAPGLQDAKNVAENASWRMRPPPPKPKPTTLRAANGALLEVPIHDDRPNASSWAAVIDIDGTAPGGLSRRWLTNGRGACYYLLDPVRLFDVIEFAADYVTSQQKKRKNRWYGVVVNLTDDVLMLERAEDGAAAVLLAKSKRANPASRREAVEYQLAAVRARMEALQGELAALENLAAKEPETT